MFFGSIYEFLCVSELPPGKTKFPFSIIPVLFYYLIVYPLFFQVLQMHLFFYFDVRFSARIVFFARFCLVLFGISLTCIVIVFLSVFRFFLILYFRRPDIFNVLSRGRGLVSRTDCVSASSNGILFTCSPDDWTALLNRHPIEDIHVFLSFFCMAFQGGSIYIPIIKRFTVFCDFI